MVRFPDMTHKSENSLLSLRKNRHENQLSAKSVTIKTMNKAVVGWETATISDA
jgi:hypothetical protein